MTLTQLQALSFRTTGPQVARPTTAPVSGSFASRLASSAVSAPSPNRLSGTSIVTTAIQQSAAEEGSDEPAAVDQLVADSRRPIGNIDTELARSSDLMMQMLHLQMQENDMRDDARSNMEKVKHDTKKNTLGNVR